MERGETRPLIADVPVELVDAMLDTLPVDITFVDSEDIVRYFSKETKHMMFARTRAIIGRRVQQCHSEKSVHVVDQLLNDFKTGKKDSAESWIDRKGRKVYIMYSAVRDSDGKYLGCVETIQDITDIQKLEGEKRLREP
jgi:PAS domain S-box-containing protein